MRSSILITIIIILCGCSSVAREKPSKSLLPEEGYISLSSGRNRKSCEDCKGNLLGILPFVYWLVVNEERISTNVVFRPQFIALSDLDESDYGYAHARSMLSGKYTLVGITDGKVIEPCYSFTVKPGVINYLGEFLTVRGDGSKDSIEHTVRFDRDMETIFRLYPYLKKTDVVRTRIERKRCTSPEDISESHLTSLGKGTH